MSSTKALETGSKAHLAPASRALYSRPARLRHSYIHSILCRCIPDPHGISYALEGSRSFKLQSSLTSTLRRFNQISRGIRLVTTDYPHPTPSQQNKISLRSACKWSAKGQYSGANRSWSWTAYSERSVLLTCFIQILRRHKSFNSHFS